MDTFLPSPPQTYQHPSRSCSLSNSSTGERSLLLHEANSSINHLDPIFNIFFRNLILSKISFLTWDFDTAFYPSFSHQHLNVLNSLKKKIFFLNFKTLMNTCPSSNLILTSDPFHRNTCGKSCLQQLPTQPTALSPLMSGIPKLCHRNSLIHDCQYTTCCQFEWTHLYHTWQRASKSL